MAPISGSQVPVTTQEQQQSLWSFDSSTGIFHTYDQVPVTPSTSAFAPPGYTQTATYVPAAPYVPPAGPHVVSVQPAKYPFPALYPQVVTHTPSLANANVTSGPPAASGNGLAPYGPPAQCSPVANCQPLAVGHSMSSITHLPSAATSTSLQTTGQASTSNSGIFQNTAKMGGRKF